VPYVRQQALTVLRSWRLDEVAWEVELLLSELVTNAVKHARTSFTVVMAWVGRRLRCEVSDGNPRPPQPQPASEAVQAGGRGLLLVDSVSSNWGVTLHQQGKTVWFDLELDRALSASGSPTPSA
jgi:anti-sigma regulatory factor (Ser/Thr protein kinase)